MNSKKMVRGALLIALALVLQSLRLVLPMPQLLSTFIIGTLVHMMLVLTLKLNGMSAAFLLGLLLPMTAYLQGQIILPFLIPVVWAGNLLFVFLLYSLSGSRNLILFVPAALKAVVMGAEAWLVVNFIQIPSEAVQQAIVFGMTVPQFVTAVCGILLSRRLILSVRKVI